ncbi:MAG: DUF1553 domain-containing protein [Planctomycetia bacterium]|nr:DUF1553 domain-containing protein [Planctomycetia bacterium]
MNDTRMLFHFVLAMLLLGVPRFASADDAATAEQLAPGMELVELTVNPAEIVFDDRFDYSQLLVTGKLSTGEELDVTRMVEVQAPSEFVEVSPTGLVRPKLDGAGELRFKLAGKEVAVPVKATGFDAKFDVSFVRDVNPALGKLGCNAGTCHGAKDGKNGFKLSLRGYDPIYDHRALTDDLEGRRFNRAAPDHSLMLLKPSGVAPHVGGVLMHPGQPYYELLRMWIAQGVKLDLDAPRVSGIEIIPQNPTLPLPGMKQQMKVLATYTNGQVRDVSAEAFLESSLTEVLTVDRAGLATGVRRGEAAVLARFEGSYAATTVVVMGDRSGFEWQQPVVQNHLDELVDAKLQRLKILPSELCTDAEFLRRVRLDLCGVPPTPEQVRAFVADERPSREKRDELIDQLIGSPEFVEHWTNKWADMLQVNRKFLGEQGATALRNWIRQAVATNMPYDQFAYAVLTADGSTLENPPAAYYKVLRTPADTMENTTQLFLAVRFNCNKCHDHPFERWTQDQYYHLAAYFAQVTRKDHPDYAEQRIGGTDVEFGKALVEIVYDQDSGEVTHDRTGKIAEPSFPYPTPGSEAESASRRVQLARWLTSKDNQYFAKSYVNRIWSYLLGVGIIEPVDDIRAGNPPSNPELLERLTNDFVASNFNVREMMRTICKSRTYQLSIVTNRWNEDDQTNYAHAVPRRLPAETLYDALQQVTGHRPALPGLPDGSLASQLPDSGAKVPDGFLELFGRPPRESACECERSSGVMLGQMLNLVNGPTFAEAIGAPSNRIEAVVREHADDAKVVEELFVAILNRVPNAAEVAIGVEAMHGAQVDREQLTEALATYERDVLPANQAAWEAQQAAQTWTPLNVESVQSAAGTQFTLLEDGSWLASGGNPDKEQVTIKARTPLESLTAIRLEVLPDDSLSARGPGRAVNGNFVLSEFRASAAAGEGDATGLSFTVAQADFSQDGWHVGGAIDGNPATGWAVMPSFGQQHTAVFELGADVQHANEAALTFELVQEYGAQHTIGRFRLLGTTAARPVRIEGLPGSIAAILATPSADRTDAQRTELAAYYRPLDEQLRVHEKALQTIGRDAAEARLRGAQDLAWALLNSPAFLFNR